MRILYEIRDDFLSRSLQPIIRCQQIIRLCIDGVIGSFAK
jgi:hypothetical protein